MWQKFGQEVKVCTSWHAKAKKGRRSQTKREETNIDMNFYTSLLVPSAHFQIGVCREHTRPAVSLESGLVSGPNTTTRHAHLLA